VGLRGMRERVRELHGTLRVDSNGRGTIVTASMPIPADSSKADMTAARAD